MLIYLGNQTGESAKSCTLSPQNFCFVGLQLFTDQPVQLLLVAPVKQTNVDEQWLIEQVLSGDRKAFEGLICQYEGLVLHIVSPLVGINADREDVCQDIFMKVYEHLGTFQFRSKLSTWIGNIAYHTSLNFLQKKRNILLADLFPDNPETDSTNESVGNKWEDEALNPEQIIIKEQELTYLAEAIDQLPVLQKTVLLLFHQDELSLEEISQILDVPVNTIKSYLFRARKALKKTLRDKIKNDESGQRL
ncbi:RNA polymerase sigma factor [Spirosoma arboris]|nr:sigma-70 family RNA polymerase sigma factor [Spirosoma arboris]